MDYYMPSAYINFYSAFWVLCILYSLKMAEFLSIILLYPPIENKKNKAEMALFLKIKFSILIFFNIINEFMNSTSNNSITSFFLKLEDTISK